MAQHWAKLPERKGLGWLKFLFKVYSFLGYNFISLLLYPVAAIFLFTGKTQRQASQQYLQQLKFYTHNKFSTKSLSSSQSGFLAKPNKLTSYQHFLHFAHAILDKLASWKGDLKLGQDINFAAASQLNQLPSHQQGGLVIGSHLGDFELCRALSQSFPNFKVHALVFNKHAQGFNKLLQQINPKAAVNLIEVDSLDPSTAVFLQERIAAGEWVAIVADRIALETTSANKADRLVWCNFLGKPAPFPQGPFILASLLKCPVYLLFALKATGHKKNHIEIYFEKFADPINLPRQAREETLNQLVEQYAARLEEFCLLSPLDWFNFYNFWELPNERT